jgi:hypothetical protein
MDADRTWHDDYADRRERAFQTAMDRAMGCATMAGFRVVLGAFADEWPKVPTLTRSEAKAMQEGGE